MNETSKKLANDHWSYIEELLKTHGISEASIDIISFHYQTAFIHGFKHGVEWIKKEQKAEITKKYIGAK